MSKLCDDFIHCGCADLLEKDGYVTVPIAPEGQLISRLRDILEAQGWRLRLSDVHQLYSGVIQAAQEKTNEY